MATRGLCVALVRLARSVDGLALYRARYKEDRPNPTSLSGLMPGEHEAPPDGSEDGAAAAKGAAQAQQRGKAGEETAAKDGGGGEGGKAPGAEPRLRGLAAGPNSGLTPLGDKAQIPDLYINRCALVLTAHGVSRPTSGLACCKADRRGARRRGGHVCRYRSSWALSVAAYKLHLESEQRRLRRMAGGAAQLALMPLPLPLSKFQWPPSQVRAGAPASLAAAAPLPRDVTTALCTPECHWWNPEDAREPYCVVVSWPCAGQGPGGLAPPLRPLCQLHAAHAQEGVPGARAQGRRGRQGRRARAADGPPAGAAGAALSASHACLSH